MGDTKNSDHVYIKFKMPNPSQEPPASSKGPNKDGCSLLDNNQDRKPKFRRRAYN